jgi:predicted nucleotidyltransferase
LELPTAPIAELCRHYQVRELAVFGSAARGELRPGSDIDFLVEFLPEARIGLIGFAGLMNRLSELLGRKVDLVSKQGLKPRIRDHVLAESQVVYAA